MLGFLARRLAAAVITLWCVITLTFFLIRLTPGGPFDREVKIPAHIQEKLLERYNLSGPLHEQYFSYLGNVMRGDLLDSTKYRDRSVNDILAQSLPVSFTIGGIAFVLAISFGLWIGVMSAARKESWVDRGAMLWCISVISIPTFVTGPLLILIFGLYLKWLPTGGWYEWKSVILPSLVLAAPYTAYVARLARGGMLDVLRQDYIRTATAKGAAPRQVVYRHALRVAILPVVSYAGPLAAHLLTGSIVIDSVFNLPGAGPFFVHSILNRDSFLLGGVVIVYCTLLVLFNIVVDVAYTYLDRRIQLNG